MQIHFVSLSSENLVSNLNQLVVICLPFSLLGWCVLFSWTTDCMTQQLLVKLTARRGYRFSSSVAVDQWSGFFVLKSVPTAWYCQSMDGTKCREVWQNNQRETVKSWVEVSFSAGQPNPLWNDLDPRIFLVLNGLVKVQNYVYLTLYYIFSAQSNSVWAILQNYVISTVGSTKCHPINPLHLALLFHIKSQ